MVKHPLTPVRRAELDRLARETLRAHLGSEGAARVPIDIAALAAGLGLRVRAVDGITGAVTDNLDGRGVSGVLDFGSGIIYVNAGEPQTRQRFTIAHELAHELLGHEHVLGRSHAVYVGVDEAGSGGALWASDPAELSPQEAAEAEADHLAGRLLVPPDALDREVARIGVASVPLLAQAFGVSPMAMQRHVRPYLPRLVYS